MTPRAHISMALLASATAHIVMLLVLTPGTRPVIPGMPGEAMRVTLIAPHRSVPTLRTTMHRATAQSEKTTDLSDVSPRRRLTTAPIQRPVSAEDEASLNASTRDSDAATITAHTLQTMLSDAFITHFHYPPLARQNGWWGEVRLALRIEPNGELTHIRILTSSGYGILDRAAMHSLEVVGRLPHAAALLRGSYFDLILPVRYQLFDS